MRNHNWVQFLMVWRTKIERFLLKIVGSSFNLGLGIFIRGWKWQLVVEAWSFFFFFWSCSFHLLLLLATSLPLFLWFFCHINVQDVFFLVATHIGGCGVLLVVATHHCQATPSPSSSSCSLDHCHYDLFVARANSCQPLPSWSYHLVLVVAMVIMVFLLL
jgi:hypothetical protein